MLAELMVQSSAALVLTNDRCRSVQPIIGVRGSGGEVRSREQRLCVRDHVLVDHARRNFVARRANPWVLNVARRRLGVSRRVTQKRRRGRRGRGIKDRAIRVVDLPCNSSEIAGELRRRGYQVLIRGGGMLPIAFIAQEEKCLPWMLTRNRKRAAKSCAKLILLEPGLVARLGLLGGRESRIHDVGIK